MNNVISIENAYSSNLTTMFQEAAIEGREIAYRWVKGRRTFEWILVWSEKREVVRKNSTDSNLIKRCDNCPALFFSCVVYTTLLYDQTAFKEPECSVTNTYSQNSAAMTQSVNAVFFLFLWPCTRAGPTTSY